jgi:hypothetical protein
MNIKSKSGTFVLLAIDTPKLGYPIVNALLSRDNVFHKPIYIDVKHGRRVKGGLFQDFA